MKLEKNKIILEFKEASRTNLNYKAPYILCYTTEIKSENYYNIIDKNSNEFPNKIFWGQKFYNKSFLALGSTYSLYSAELRNSHFCSF